MGWLMRLRQANRNRAPSLLTGSTARRADDGRSSIAPWPALDPVPQVGAPQDRGVIRGVITDSGNGESHLSGRFPDRGVIRGVITDRATVYQ